jgi:hypothetical protein
MGKTMNKSSPEVRVRAVRLVLDDWGQHLSHWQVAKIGSTLRALTDCVKKIEANRGRRGHPHWGGRED